MNRKVAMVLACILTFSLLFTACGGGSSSSSGAAESPSVEGSADSAAPSDTAAEGADMTFWIFLNPESDEDPRNVVLKEIVDEYNQNNAMGNTVTVESHHWSTFEADAIQAAAAGTGPDIINMYTDMIKQHIAGGTVQPMTAYAQEFIPTMDGYVYSEDSLKIDGEIYSLPWESRTFVYWYRTDIFPTAPTTLEELATMSGAQTTAINQGFVIGLSESSNAASFMESFVPFLRSAGGSLFNADGTAAFNSDAGVKALGYFKTMIDSNAMDQTSLSATVDDIVDAFKAGTILSCNAGTQRAANIRSSELSGSIASAPILGFADGTNPSPAVVAGQSLGIGKFANSPDAAFDFIKTFYTTENQVKWLGDANVLPVLTGVYENESIKALENFDELKMWNEYAATGQVEFYPENYGELSVELARAAQQVVFQGADAQTELDKVAEWYNK